MALHTIHFMRPINPDTLVGFQTCALSALAQGATEITVYISSGGGNNDQGFALYNFLRSLPVPLTVHCIGNVDSMAVLMFLAGDKRIIVPHGRITVHPMLWGFNASTVDHDRLAEYVGGLDFDSKRYADIFEERTKGAAEPLDVKSHLGGKAKLLDASAAVKAGVATEIADAKIPATAVKWWVP